MIECLIKYFCFYFALTEGKRTRTWGKREERQRKCDSPPFSLPPSRTLPCRCFERKTSRYDGHFEGQHQTFAIKPAILLLSLRRRSHGVLRVLLDQPELLHAHVRLLRYHGDRGPSHGGGLSSRPS